MFTSSKVSSRNTRATSLLSPWIRNPHCVCALAFPWLSDLPGASQRRSRTRNTRSAASHSVCTRLSADGQKQRLTLHRWTHLHRAVMLLPEGSSPVSFALVVSFYFLDSNSVLAFNLDTSHVIRKSGDSGTLFGFSLAMHRQLNPDKRM